MATHTPLRTFALVLAGAFLLSALLWWMFFLWVHRGWVWLRFFT